MSVLGLEGSWGSTRTQGPSANSIANFQGPNIQRQAFELLKQAARDRLVDVALPQCLVGCRGFQVQVFGHLDEGGYSGV